MPQHLLQFGTICFAGRNNGLSCPPAWGGPGPGPPERHEGQEGLPILFAQLPTAPGTSFEGPLLNIELVNFEDQSERGRGLKLNDQKVKKRVETFEKYRRTESEN